MLVDFEDVQIDSVDEADFFSDAVLALFVVFPDLELPR